MNLEELTKKALHIKNLYAEYEKEKFYKEWTVEETYQGLVSDVGDLGRLVLAKEGFREVNAVDEHMSHELAEILWATLLLAEHYNVDLTQAFTDEMKRLEDRLA